MQDHNQVISKKFDTVDKACTFIRMALPAQSEIIITPEFVEVKYLSVRTTINHEKEIITS